MARSVRAPFFLALLVLNLVVLVLGNGTQFITGACKSDADCASGCCGFNSGKCAGPIVAQERDGGCGFGDPQPNDNAARALRGQAPTTLATVAAPKASQPAAAAGTAGGAVCNGAGVGNANANANAGTAAGAATAAQTTAANAANAGNGAGNKAGKQFITGACTSDADCASGCCGFKSGKCAGPIVAQERDGGCGFGNAQPNDNAAQKLRGQQPASA